MKMLCVVQEDKNAELEWKTRLRQKWLKEGDFNTRFFHQVASARRRNWIERLLIHGEEFSVREVGRAAVNYFREFTSRYNRGCWRLRGEDIRCVIDAQVERLMTSFSEDEVRQAVWGLSVEGCPGSDDFLVFFLGEFWSLVGSDVMEMLEEFAAGNRGFDKLNRFYIFLLPKKGAEDIRDFRLIALSNAVYLIVAKVLTNRLRDVLEDLISRMQMAFVPGRGILDEFVIAMEVLATWKREKKQVFLWNVDFSKAYDLV
jgi:hypothetical protein